MVTIAKTVPETDSHFATAQALIGDASSSGIVDSGFMNFFLILFIAAVGLSVGGKIRKVFNATGVKLVVIGILIPIVSMALTFGCLKLAPSLMGQNYSGFSISGMYSGSMTNTAAFGNSMAVVSNTDFEVKYEQASDAEKIKALKMTGVEDTSTIPDSLTPEQIGTLKGISKGKISQAYAVAFPVGTIIIILAMTAFAALFKKQSKKEDELLGSHTGAGSPIVSGDGKKKPFFFNALTFGIVVVFGYLLGWIKIPLGNGTTFSFSFVGGVLIVALIVANLPQNKYIAIDPAVLGFIREFGLLFFMSVIGLSYGYQVVTSFSGSGLVVAIMAAIVEIIAVIIAILVGRLLKLKWDLLAGAICGGCTSSVGLGTAIVTMDSDEPGIAYGVSQPFAILANVLLVAWLHGLFFL